MNKGIIGFLLGGVTGSLVTFFIVKEKYKRIADEEIESVKERFKEREKEIFDLNTEKDQPNPSYVEGKKWYEKEAEKNNEKMNEVWENAMKKIGYQTIETDASNSSDTNIESIKNIDDYTVKIEQKEDKIKPYLISEEEYGEFGNDEITLIYSSDNILIDEDNHIIDDVQNIVGDTLSEFEKDLYLDSILVRNENMGIDYTILKSEKTYDELNPEEE